MAVATQLVLIMPYKSDDIICVTSSSNAQRSTFNGQPLRGVTRFKSGLVRRASNTGTDPFVFPPLSVERWALGVECCQCRTKPAPLSFPYLFPTANSLKNE